MIHLLGYDIQWASFHIIQAISLSSQKRNGYMAASLVFNADLPGLIMATNVFKKDLNSYDPIEVKLVLHTMANIMTADLARDLHNDVLLKLNHSNCYIRKLACMVLRQMALKYSDCFSFCLSKIMEKLDDENNSE